jgi:hypothetical protein
MSRGQGPENAVVRPVVEYLPDRHGAQLFGALTRGINRTLNSANPIAENSPTYYGVVARNLQRFTGAAGLGAAAIYSKRAPEMNAQRTTTDSATAAIFASRMARGA